MFSKQKQAFQLISRSLFAELSFFQFPIHVKYKISIFSFSIYNKFFHASFSKDVGDESTENYVDTEKCSELIENAWLGGPCTKQDLKVMCQKTCNLCK